uniref:Beclin-1-like protein n=1 Tax=Heterorhabditis bacteriophora TaxID=37862 RepID=A0A1I7XD25_HETBA
MSTQIQTEQRTFMCLNCQSPLKLDVNSREDKDKKISLDVDSADGLEGQSRNLLQIICDAEVPTDAPICKECSDALLTGMDQQLDTLEDDCSSYRQLIECLKSKHSNSDILAHRQTLRNLKEEERVLEAELQRLILEEKRLDDEQLEKKRELECRTEEEARLWRQFRDNHRRLLDIDEKTRKVDAELRYAEAQHRKLAGLNVLDLCFHIWVDSTDGTIVLSLGEINGFRLGRLPDRAVDWPEINAAWGQAVLLLDVTFNSCINAENECSPRKLQTDCYGKSFLYKGQAAQNPAFRLLYRINKDRLVQGNMEYSAKMLLNSEERWTKAMKILLANLRGAIVQVVAARPPAS